MSEIKSQVTPLQGKSGEVKKNELTKQVSVVSKNDLHSSKEVKGLLKMIYLNYCDFNEKTGKSFISQEKLQKMFRDAQIVGSKSDQITESQSSIILSKTLKSKGINLKKNIDFT